MNIFSKVCSNSLVQIVLALTAQLLMDALTIKHCSRCYTKQLTIVWGRATEAFLQQFFLRIFLLKLGECFQLCSPFLYPLKIEKQYHRRHWKLNLCDLCISHSGCCHYHCIPLYVILIFMEVYFGWMMKSRWWFKILIRYWAPEAFFLPPAIKVHKTVLN